MRRVVCCLPQCRARKQLVRAELLGCKSGPCTVSSRGWFLLIYSQTSNPGSCALHARANWVVILLCCFCLCGEVFGLSVLASAGSTYPTCISSLATTHRLSVHAHRFWGQTGLLVNPTVSLHSSSSMFMRCSFLLHGIPAAHANGQGCCASRSFPLRSQSSPTHMCACPNACPNKWGACSLFWLCEGSYSKWCAAVLALEASHIDQCPRSLY